jgi:hypothetical protein
VLLNQFRLVEVAVRGAQLLPTRVATRTLQTGIFKHAQTAGIYQQQHRILLLSCFLFVGYQRPCFACCC